jgi:hypothetical protein
VIEREPHMRFAAALNLGIRSTTMARIGFLLTDDWLAPDCVEKCLRHETDIVSTAFTCFAADGATELDVLSRSHSEAAFERLQKPADRANYLTHFLFFRREALDGVGGVDETIGDSPGVDDFDLPWCMLERGASVTIVEERLYNYRDHEGERLTTRGREEMAATFNRILDKHHVTGPEREQLFREHARWFGRSMLSVYKERSMLSVYKERSMLSVYKELEIPEVPGFLKPVQTLYRSVVPLQARLAIRDRIIPRRRRERQF